jgi:hypothetical protein
LEQKPYACSLDSFFEVMRGSSYQPVVLPGVGKSSIMHASVALLPTAKGSDMCILTMEFETLTRLAESSIGAKKVCFSTPDSFVTGANVPLRNSWTDIQRELFFTNPAAAPMGRASSSPLAAVAANRITAQNSLSAVENLDGAARIQIFATGVCLFCPFLLL